MTEVPQIVIDATTLQDMMIVQKHTSLDAFWPFIQSKFPNYKARREYIWEAFRPFMAIVEGRKPESPADVPAREALDLRPDYAAVRAVYEKTLSRRDTDPDGAITIARSLLESLLKHMLDDLGVAFDPNAKLPALYGAVAQALQLAPGGTTHTGIEMPAGAKQVLGGCVSVVQGFASLRNDLSDSHGKTKGAMVAEPRRAELAVNLTFALATFLVRTHDARKGG